MIAYRAETAMAQKILRQNMRRHDDAGSLLRAIYSTEVDIVPDPQANTLTIRLHPLANTSSDLAVRHLCADLNTTETLFSRHRTALNLRFGVTEKSMRSGGLNLSKRSRIDR
jgi:hypothetical protein